MSEEFSKKYRPKKLSQVVGQPSVVSYLEQRLGASTLPHSLLFCGPSGCGKTTVARIVATSLGCLGQDFSEVNCADFRGIDMVRDIRSTMHLKPLGGKCRIWLIDEAHKLSNDAMNAFLKITEETPSHVYFLFATTDPDKLLATLRSRCTILKIQPLSNPDMQKLLDRIIKRENLNIGEDVRDKLIDMSEGGARRALVLLDQISTLAEEEAQMAQLQKADIKRQGIELARALLNKSTKWPQIGALLKSIDEDPEQLRWMVLGYCNAVLKNKADPRAYLIIRAFSEPFYDNKGAGLTAACYEVIFP